MGGQAVQGGLSCPHLGNESYFFSCSFNLPQISEYEVDSFITIIQVKLSCYLCCLVSLTFVAGVGGGGQAVQGGLSCPHLGNMFNFF